jgi:hypothetical protein
MEGHVVRPWHSGMTFDRRIGGEPVLRFCFCSAAQADEVTPPSTTQPRGDRWRSHCDYRTHRAAWPSMPVPSRGPARCRSDRLRPAARGAISLLPLTAARQASVRRRRPRARATPTTESIPHRFRVYTGSFGVKLRVRKIEFPSGSSPGRPSRCRPQIGDVK